MHKLKRLLGLVGFTGILGALAFVAPANAAVKAQCIVDGEAKATTTKPTAVKYVQLSGGKGTFAFTSVTITCVDLSSNKTGQNPSTGLVTASGTFRNSTQLPNGSWVDTPCGQGKVMGKITSVAMDNPKYSVLNGKKFAVVFGPPTVGLFYWHTANPNKPSTVPKLGQDTGDPRYTTGKDNPNGMKPYRYAGQIQLGPSQTKDNTGKIPPPADKCAKAFHVNGTVLVDEA